MSDHLSQSETSSQTTDLRVAEPDKYPPSFDVEIVKAIHWCRLGRVRPDDESAFHRAKELGLLAQDPVWRATERGEGVLVALGLLDAKPAPKRTCRVVLWAVSDRYLPHIVDTWSSWAFEEGTAEIDAAKAAWSLQCDGPPWRFWTTHEYIDVPPVPDAEEDDDAC